MYFTVFFFRFLVNLKRSYHILKLGQREILNKLYELLSRPVSIAFDEIVSHDEIKREFAALPCQSVAEVNSFT